MAEDAQKITVRPNGPYIVTGGIPLVRKTPVVSENGEPLSWQKGEVVTTDERYALCRCGHSANKPFCDGRHRAYDFEAPLMILHHDSSDES